MLNKVKRIADTLAEKIKNLEDIEAITLGHAADADVYDPYFSLTVDVYYRGLLPVPLKREELYGNIEYFVTSQYDRIDTFLCEDLPVQVEYIHADLIDRVIHELEDPTWFFKQRGSHIFHRLEFGRILWQFTDWIDSMKDRVENLPEEVWNYLRKAAESEMETTLTELGAAMLKNDQLYFADALARYLKSMTRVLLSVNRRLEPHPRQFHKTILDLDYLPEHFQGRYASIIRLDGTIDMSQKRKIAELLSKSIFSMS